MTMPEKSQPEASGYEGAASSRDVDAARQITWREVVAVSLLVVLADVTIYRGAGFAADALLFALAPGLLWLGTAQRPSWRGPLAVAVLLGLASLKLLWCGSGLLVACSWGLLFAFARTLSGQCPYVLETLVSAAQTIRSGYDGLVEYGNALERRNGAVRWTPWLNVGLPVAALLAFGTVFTLANPDLVTLFSERMRGVLSAIQGWLNNFSPLEILFWTASFWVSVGLIRPSASRFDGAVSEQCEAVAAAPAGLFVAFRNMLVAVIGLFAVYLVYEFNTLWFHDFPDEFFFTGRVHKYAHEGAAWLTIALAMATVVLSLVFRGRTFGDPRLPILKRLAWLWSLENALLAITVYHRLFIYIGFNGMTRMRVVGLLGISCVVIGFSLVLWKIAFHRRFVWLIRRQLWTVAAAMGLFALLPIDPIIHRYNVHRILAGDPAPSVQISAHPISIDGYLVLEPLLDAPDERIREGIHALLAEQRIALERAAHAERVQGWSTFQFATHVLRGRLDAIAPRLQPYDDDIARAQARQRFAEYAHRWY